MTDKLKALLDAFLAGPISGLSSTSVETLVQSSYDMGKTDGTPAPVPAPDPKAVIFTQADIDKAVATSKEQIATMLGKDLAALDADIAGLSAAPVPPVPPIPGPVSPPTGPAPTPAA